MDKKRSKKEPPRKGKEVRGVKTKAVYSFDEDDVSGELVRPSGSAVSARGPDVDYDGIADDTDKRPEEPQDVPAGGEAAVGGDVGVGGVGGGGGGKGVAEAPTPVTPDVSTEPPPDKANGRIDADAALIPEPMPLESPKFASEIVAVQRKSVGRPLAGVARRIRARFRQRTADAASAAPATTPAPAFRQPTTQVLKPPAQAAPPAGPAPTSATTVSGSAVATADDAEVTKTEADRAQNIPAGMPTPVVHASALSVVVPTVGEAVRYQRLLLPAGATYEVEISAKEPLFARK